MTHIEKDNPSTAATPEDALCIRPNSEPLDLDAVQAITTRTSALLDMLTGYFATPTDNRAFVFSDHRLAAYLWQINGNIDLIRKWVDHANLKQREPTGSC